MFAHVVLTSWSHGCHVTDYGEFLGGLPQLMLVLAHDSPILSRSRLAYEPKVSNRLHAPQLPVLALDLLIHENGISQREYINNTWML